RMPEASTAEMCTKTSFAPSSGVMKPKPLVALKNFTVPVWAMGKLLSRWSNGVHATCVASPPPRSYEVGERVVQKRFQSPGLQPPERLGTFSRDRGESKAELPSGGTCSCLADLYRRHPPENRRRTVPATNAMKIRYCSDVASSAALGGCGHARRQSRPRICCDHGIGGGRENAAALGETEEGGPRGSGIHLASKGGTAGPHSCLARRITRALRPLCKYRIGVLHTLHIRGIAKPYRDRNRFLEEVALHTFLQTQTITPGRAAAGLTDSDGRSGCGGPLAHIPKIQPRQDGHDQAGDHVDPHRRADGGKAQNPGGQDRPDAKHEVGPLFP